MLKLFFPTIWAKDGLFCLGQAIMLFHSMWCLESDEILLFHESCTLSLCMTNLLSYGWLFRFPSEFPNAGKIGFISLECLRATGPPYLLHLLQWSSQLSTPDLFSISITPLTVGLYLSEKEIFGHQVKPLLSVIATSLNPFNTLIIPKLSLLLTKW